MREAASPAGGEEEATSPTAAQLRRGFATLRFEDDLERAYAADQFRDGLRFLRFNLTILAVIILTIIQIDHEVLPAVGRIVPDFARVGVMVPLLALGFGLSFLRQAEVWYPRLMAYAMALALMAIGWIALEAWADGESRLFVRLVIATIAVYFVLGLPFRRAFAANLAGIAVFAAAAAGRAMPGPEMTHYLAMLLMANVICAAGAYKLEHARRTAWLEGQLLAETALLDGLTGIPNRRRFDEHLLRVWNMGMRENRQVALLFGDIDHFKAYNDRYGHQAGDEALKAVAGVLARFARRSMDLAARFGGEEFGLLLYDLKREHAERIGEEILDAVRRLEIVHEASAAAPVLTISLGIACVQPVARRSPAGLLQLADQALYAAKDGGRNQSRVLEAEYQHLQTGYFHRKLLQEGGEGRPGAGQ